MSCLFFVSVRKEVFPFLSFLVKRMLGVHRLHWRRPKKAAASRPRPERAVTPRSGPPTPVQG